MQKTYTGGCHCGAVKFRVTTDLAGILDCNCSICTKKGFLHLIVEPDRFELLTDRAALSTYTFGTGTAKHHFCATCGMHPFYIPRSHPDKIDVNVRCIDGLDLGTLDITPYDGQNWEQARADLG
ncbi:MAG: GFA family protein [Rhodospirillaceae bacterium]|nr:GFA family protein [Rhodospirillaceae bacterium]